jgi:menaquinone-dependent protoporphyrinogen IX oxidase
MATFEEMMETQEASEGKVQNSAVTKAQEQLQKEKEEQEARTIMRRLSAAEEYTKEAVREGRYASKQKNILKKYSEGLENAKSALISSGDTKAYDKAVDDLKEEKRKALAAAEEETGWNPRYNRW